jgi:hypothetical protein
MHYCAGDKIEKSEMGGARSLREIYHWEDPGIDGKIIFKTDLHEVGCEGMD